MTRKDRLRRVLSVAFLMTVAVFWILLLTNKILLDINHNIVIYGGEMLLLIGFGLLSNDK